MPLLTDSPPPSGISHLVVAHQKDDIFTEALPGGALSRFLRDTDVYASEWGMNNQTRTAEFPVNRISPGSNVKLTSPLPYIPMEYSCPFGLHDPKF